MALRTREKWLILAIIVIAVVIGLSVYFMNNNKDNFKQKANPLPLKNMMELVKQKQKILPPRPKPLERYVPPANIPVPQHPEPETFINKTPIADVEPPVVLPAIPEPVVLPEIPSVIENFEEAVDIPPCPCGDNENACEPGCTCGKCANVEKFHQKQEVWVQNIIPISSSIKSSTRSGADVIRGDVPISSSGASQGWFKTSESNRTLEKGARQLVFGM